MRLIILYVILFQVVFSSPKININNITFQELTSLPISYDQQFAIKDFLDNRGYISSIYELLDIPEISSKDLQNLRHVVEIKLPDISDVQKKIASNSYKLENNWHNFSAFNFELAYGEIVFRESLSLEKYSAEISP